MLEQLRTASASGPTAQPYYPPLCATLLDVATPQLYRVNPFRKTGLNVLASARDVAKRMDQLTMSAELETGPEHWSFAPETGLTVDQIREVAQVLKEPEERLVHEFFWFWPEHYPEDSPADAAIGFLARGETARAVEHWEDPARADRPAALHNLAVYYHLQALELERLDSPSEQDLAELWMKAIRSWDRVRNDDTIWMRMRARVTALADARVPVELIEQMRKTVPDALAKICAALALSHGEQGRGSRGALQAAMVMHIHGDNTDARRALETRAAPVARRIDTRVNETKLRAGTEADQGLAEARALAHASDEDLSLIEILCGRTSEYYREVSQGVADTMLNLLVAYQRQTGDDRGCLPVLIHLLGMEATPELKLRLADTYKIVHRNALSGQHRDVPEKRLGPMAEEKELSDHEKDFQLLRDHVIPGLAALGLGRSSHTMDSARVGGLLKNLAFAAFRENDNRALAAEALAAALELACDDDTRAGLHADRAQLQHEFEQREEKELRLQNATSVIQINRHGVDLDGQWMAATDLAGLRHGVESGATGSAAEATYVIAWRTADGREFKLDGTNFLAPSEHSSQDYARILDTFYYFFVPDLVDRLAAAVRRGEAVLIGEMPVTRQGVLLASLVRYGVRDELVSYDLLEFKSESGQLILSSELNPWLSDSWVFADAWNAVIFGQLVEAVRRE